MTINNNLFNPIPLFESKDEWYKNKQTYKGKSSPTIAPCNYILPMQLTIDRDLYEELTSDNPDGKLFFYVVKATGGDLEKLSNSEIYNSTEQLPVEIQTQENYATMYIGGKYITSYDFGIGTYYLQIMYGVVGDLSKSKTWYSDLFTWHRNTYDMLHIGYRNSEPIITENEYMPFYQTINDSPLHTKMEMWLDIELMNSEFAFEDTTTMQDGYERVEKRISYKKYVAVFPATEYMVEALRLLWHCDSIAMRQRNKRYNIHDVNMEVVWEQDNHFAKVTMKFKTDSIIQTNANAMYMDSARYADFDDDYNIDFDV